MRTRSSLPSSLSPQSTATPNSRNFSDAKYPSSLSRAVFFDLYAPKPPAPPTLTPPQPTLADPPKPKGLFQEVLGGDLGALYQDMREHPEKYDAETVRLVEGLLAANRAPLPEELPKLDLAVLDFNKVMRPEPKRPKPVIRRPPPEPPAESPPPLEPVTPPSADAIGKTDEIPQAFWWLRSK